MICEEQKHVFTHIDLYYEIMEINLRTSVEDKIVSLPDTYQWVPLNKLKSYAMPAPFLKWVRDTNK